MSDAEKVSLLEARVEDLERQIRWLMVQDLTTINVLRSVLLANRLNQRVQVGEELTEPHEKLGTIFDRIAELAQEPSGNDRR